MARGVKGSGPKKATKGRATKRRRGGAARGGYKAPELSVTSYSDERDAEAAVEYAAKHKGVKVETTRAENGVVEKTKVSVAMPTKIGVKALLRSCKRNEPIFVLRAQDALAAPLVRQWATEAARLGVNQTKVDLARAMAEAMENWPGRRLPD